MKETTFALGWRTRCRFSLSDPLKVPRRCFFCSVGVCWGMDHVFKLVLV